MSGKDGHLAGTFGSLKNYAFFGFIFEVRVMRLIYGSSLLLQAALCVGPMQMPDSHRNTQASR
jgi:hypothetical protein